MRHLGRTLALYGGFWVVTAATGFDASTAHAQAPVAPAPTYVAPTYVAPNQGVLPRFAPRGGIGTTPFLGNVRGLGSYSVNYDKPTPVRSTPRTTRRWFRRWQ